MMMMIWKGTNPMKPSVSWSWLNFTLYLSAVYLSSWESLMLRCVRIGGGVVDRYKFKKLLGDI